MELESKLQFYIEKESEKLSLRHHAYHNAVALENKRKKNRQRGAILVQAEKPEHWNADKKFNPFYVGKNSRAIAKSIARKISERAYSPNPPEISSKPKKDGGFRDVSMYQIPDAAVSSFYYHRLINKNKHRFSSFSYAYRNDRNVHFAIQDIAIELSNYSRVFVAEFDFSKYFDSIDHDYLYDQFDKNGFLVSNEERFVIKAFLASRDRGIPQGTSISLFLANLACWSLDKKLEKCGLQFARYADDTIIWSEDYEKINKAYQIMFDFSVKAGVDINKEKSDGISLLCDDSMPSEFSRQKSEVEFLGYSISVDRVSIKRKSEEKIKRQITYILYKHLVKPLMKRPLVAVQIPANDRDKALLSAICEIRRYLYGNLSEDMIAAYLSGRSGRIFFKGVMSFYPIIDDVEQMRRLDGWLVNAIYKSVKKRGRLLASHRLDRSHSLPFRADQNELKVYCSKQIINGKRLMKIPSFMTIFNAMQKGLKEMGVAGIVDPISDSYNY